MDYENKESYGYISGIYGSLIEVKGLAQKVRLFDLIKIEKRNILSEVIQIHKDYVIAQCFESTFNLKLNEKVISLHEPLSMELAPGLLSHIFDGIQRPLEKVYEKINKGAKFQALSRKKKWHFIPLKSLNEKVKQGDIIGFVQETPIIENKILIPNNIYGKITYIAKEGDYTIIDEIYRIKLQEDEKSFCMLQKSPITRKRPFKKKIDPKEPLLTGIRAIDLLFPVAKGGTIAIPGGFGTGKTVIQECIAKYCNADVVIFIGCGEPGNEIASILKQFTETIDPKTERPLLDRIILIVNTSNMPASAREASLFSGVTIAEYYRDMGYDVAVIADSTSRWAESLREISSLLEEMPAEEGYPAYLPSKLSRFYERAGLFKILGQDSSSNDKFGSLTIISSISPPGGDFNEPVTAASKRVVRGIWVLDSRLAYLKHYPAIDWLNSYSIYPEYVASWWKEKNNKWEEFNFDWLGCREQVNEILSKENEFKLALQLTGEIDLLDSQKFDILMAKLIRNSFLIQDAYDKIDSFTDFNKLLSLIKLILLFYEEGKVLLRKGFQLREESFNDIIKIIKNVNLTIPNENFRQVEKIKNSILQESLNKIFLRPKSKIL
ncbi:MAG: V-type ATP synthase subunit A [Candidatus Odinarchaeota archaeon]